MNGTPSANCFSQRDTFDNAVADAFSYMRGKHPGDVNAAIEMERARIVRPKVAIKRVSFQVSIVFSATLAVGQMAVRLIPAAISSDPTQKAFVDGYLWTPDSPAKNARVTLTGQQGGRDTTVGTTSDSRGFFLFNRLDAFDRESTLRLRSEYTGYESEDILISHGPSRPHYHIEYYMPKKGGQDD